MVELFIANQQFKRDVIENPKIKADIKATVSDEIMIDRVTKAEKVPDEVDDESKSESDIIDAMSRKAQDKADWLDPT